MLICFFNSEYRSIYQWRNHKNHCIVYCSVSTLNIDQCRNFKIEYDLRFLKIKNVLSESSVTRKLWLNIFAPVIFSHIKHFFPPTVNFFKIARKKRKEFTRIPPLPHNTALLTSWLRVRLSSDIHSIPKKKAVSVRLIISLTVRFSSRCNW